MIKKRIAAGLSAGVFCIGAVCACGNTSNSNGSAVMEDNGPMTLFLSQNDEWLTELKASCAEAAENNGYYLETICADSDADNQIEQIKNASTEGEGAFLVNLVDPSRADEAIEAAGNRDIVFINRAPTDLSILDDTHVYVGSEETEAGLLQGQVLAEYCQSEGLKNINYLLLEGPKSLESSSQRAQAVLDILSDTEYFTLTQISEPIIADYDRQLAKDGMAGLIKDGVGENDIDVVISTNDAMALGASEAMTQAGWTELPAVIGVDGLPEAVEAVKNNTMMMTAYQDADRQAETAVAVANNLNHGLAYDQNIIAADRIDNHIFWISFQSVTADNAEQFIK